MKGKNKKKKKKSYSRYEMRVFIYVLINGSCKTHNEIASGWKDNNRRLYKKPFEKLKNENTLKENCFGRWMFDYSMLGKNDNEDIKKLQDPKYMHKLKEKLNSDEECRKRLANPTPENMNYFYGRKSKENVSINSINERLEKVKEDYNK